MNGDGERFAWVTDVPETDLQSAGNVWEYLHAVGIGSRALGGVAKKIDRKA